MPEISPSKYLVNAGWNDVPHLDETTKRELLAATQPYLREARSQGIPSLGAGAIYPIPVDEVTCDPFAIPDHWKRSFAFDVGWNKSAALWSAHDPATGQRYVYAEYYRGKVEPSIHATALKARGDWIPGCIDPASRGRSQGDGTVLLHTYRNNGLTLTPANNSVESGLDLVWVALSTGQTKIFKTCANTLAEYRLYRRDENGKIIKKFDHLMDCLRYGEISGKDIAIVKPAQMRGSGSTNQNVDTTAGY